MDSGRRLIWWRTPAPFVLALLLGALRPGLLEGQTAAGTDGGRASATNRLDLFRADGAIPLIASRDTARLSANAPSRREQELLPWQAFSAAISNVAAEVRPSVVHIEADKAHLERNPSGPGPSPMTEAGAGIIVRTDNDYYVLTNHHVIRDSRRDQIHVFLSDQRVVQPQAVWSDVSSDVAVLHVIAPALIAAKIGDSDRVQIGDLVLAYGSPFGLSYSVSHGIVSAKGRRNLELGIDGVRIQDFLQTDAAINPGNSGGPLFNLSGEVIGLNTAIASNSGGNDGIGFAIPVNLATHVASQLIYHGRVVRPYLGIRLDERHNVRPRTVDVPGTFPGAKVSHVSAGSPAEKAGLLVGDVILQIDGWDVEDDGHLIHLIGTRPTPGRCDLVVRRKEETKTLSVELLERQ